MNLAVTDSQQTKFERGFKTWSENTAVTVRSSLNLKQFEPLSPTVLAKHLDVLVWNPGDVPGLSVDAASYLVSPEGDEWSAVTVRAASKDVVVLNPSHVPARQVSDLMHELAHIIRKHVPAQLLMMDEIGVAFRSFNEVQESEANWLAGCLLLPRPALAYHAAGGWSRDRMCDHFKVSTELLRYRLNVTGVGRQYRI